MTENAHQTIFTTDWKTHSFGRDRHLKILIISKNSTCTQEKNTLTCIIVFSQIKRNILTILVLAQSALVYFADQNNIIIK